MGFPVSLILNGDPLFTSHMAISEARIHYLLKAFTSGAATPAEQEELYQWVAGENGDAPIEQHVRELVNAYREGELTGVNWDNLYRKIKSKTHAGESVSHQRQRSRWRLAAAAAVAVLIAAGGLYLFIRPGKPAVEIARITPPSGNYVTPGTEKAFLKAGGSQVVLNKQDTSFVLAGNTVHINQGGLQIVDQRPVQYTLETPRGGQYSLTLADGTKVWLNAASELQYPSIFTGETREVTLKGEAYFEVKGDPGKPFVVHTSRQDIRVLGTEFNVQAYGDEKIAVTTLVRGKVAIRSEQKEMVLQPGDQALSAGVGELTQAVNADVEQAVAWKNGYFRFDKADIHTIMHQLARWYDVKVVYGPGLQSNLFGAIISRDNDLSKVLHMLEQTGAVHFVVAGKEVRVEP